MTTVVRPPRPGPIENLRLTNALFADPPAVLDGLAERFGPICELGPPGARVVVIGGAHLVEELLSLPESAFRWAHKFNVVGLRFVIGRRSMIVSDGTEHHRRRGAVQPSFSRRRVMDLAPLVVARTDDAVDELGLARSGATIDVYPVGRRLLLGITLEALFGPVLAAQVDTISALYERPQGFIEAPLARQLPHPLPGTNRARVRADRRDIDTVIEAEIARRKVTARPGSSDVACPAATHGADALDALMAASDLDHHEVLDQARTLIGAGYDTTAASLSWLLLLAAATPGVWERVRAEADDAFSDPVDANTVTRLRFTQQVVRESLRLHPAGLVSARAAARDIELGSWSIRTGSLLLWSPHLAGRDRSVWADPLVFDPDRFGDGRALTTGATVGWVPFGHGPHACIGFGLAQLELVLILARLAHHFDVAPALAELPRPVGMIVNRPQGGAPLHVAPRVASSRAG